jgi:ABC-2 type transport system permease protein
MMLRAYLGLIRKELIQVRRDPNMLRIIFAMPVIQLLLLGYTVNLDVKNIRLDVYDYDRTQYSRRLVDAMRPGGYFLPDDSTYVLEPRPLWTLESRFKGGDADMALIIPNRFSERITKHRPATVGLMIDGADANQARIGQGYAAQIVERYSRQFTRVSPSVEIREDVLYNPDSESVNYMVPGIVATLLMMVTVMLTAMAIVREREIGTLEQLMVTPISGWILLMGKITTFGLLGILEMAVALALGVLWFGIPFVGSPILLLLLSGLFLVTTLGMGMFFSTVSSTQQQAMFLAWFFSVFAILTSGFFTPIFNMPRWVQVVTYLNPMRYFVVIVRGIMMKDAGISDLYQDILALVVYGTVVFGFSAMRFRKRVD